MAKSTARDKHRVALRLRRGFFGPLTRALNPLIRRVAGGSRTPVVSLVYHRGRRSGRTYASPVGVGSTGREFLIPLTFGADADWCRNVLAAGRCSILWRGRKYTAVEPEVVIDDSVRSELADAFDPIQRFLLRAMGTHAFLRIRIADAGNGAEHAAQRLPLSFRVLRLVLPMFARLHRSLYRRSGGAIGGRISGNPMLLLTTTGRKTGHPRTTPLGYIRDGDHLVVIAGAGGSPKHPDWWLNLQARPQVEIQVGTRRLKVRAERATTEEARRILSEHPEQGHLYESMQHAVRRRIPIVILRPITS